MNEYTIDPSSDLYLDFSVLKHFFPDLDSQDQQMIYCERLMQWMERSMHMDCVTIFAPFKVW
jgi:hypothetical protein